MTHRLFMFALFLSLCLLVLFSCGCASAGQIISSLGPVISGILSVVASAGAAIFPAEAAAITAGVTLVTAGLSGLEKLVSNYKANPTDATLSAVQAAFNDVQTNLAALMAAAQVKDPKTQAKVTAIINAATQTLAALESSILAQHPATVAAAQGSSS